MIDCRPNHVLRRTRPSRSGCNLRVPRARSPSLGRLDGMKVHILSLLAASFLFYGCESAEERLNRTNLQPYTNITPGTIVLVQTRGECQHYTRIDTSGRPRQFRAKFGGDYIFQGIS